MNYMGTKQMMFGQSVLRSMDEAKLRRLQALERELGVVLVPFEAKPQPAALSEEQLAKVREVELELGAVLVAIDGYSAKLAASAIGQA